MLGAHSLLYLSAWQPLTLCKFTQRGHESVIENICSAMVLST